MQMHTAADQQNKLLSSPVGPKWPLLECRFGDVVIVERVFQAHKPGNGSVRVI